MKPAGVGGAVGGVVMRTGSWLTVSCGCAGGMAGKVGKARYKFEVKAPKTTGPAGFDAVFRAQYVMWLRRDCS